MNSNVRPENMARITTKELADKFIAEQVALVREQVGDKKVLSTFRRCRFLGSCSAFNKSYRQAIGLRAC